MKGECSDNPPEYALFAHISGPPLKVSVKNRYNGIQFFLDSWKKQGYTTNVFWIWYTIHDHQKTAGTDLSYLAEEI